jgi:hypothetical protein
VAGLSLTMTQQERKNLMDMYGNILIEKLRARNYQNLDVEEILQIVLRLRGLLLEFSNAPVN